MYLKELELVHFKNFEKIKLNFSPRLNCITGLNGMGKTNILDAIHCLCVGKSHFNMTDVQIIQTEYEFARLAGNFSISDNVEYLVMKVSLQGKKVLERNGVNYKKIADHLGLLPVVMIAPDSSEMITGTGEERRRFMDTSLCQLDNLYTSHLSAYNRILKQRNAHLKMSHNTSGADLLLDTYDKQLLEPSNYIYNARKTYIKDLEPKVEECYKEISSDRETVKIVYQSQLENNDLPELLIANRQKDLVTQRTRIGIHRDDLLIYMDGMDARKFSSQGQVKSILFAIKFAEYLYLSQKRNNLAILLLDDIFDKLDTVRVFKLLGILSSPLFGQIFITDTTTERLIPGVQSIYTDFKSIRIENGGIIEEEI